MMGVTSQVAHGLGRQGGGGGGDDEDPRRQIQPPVGYCNSRAMLQGVVSVTTAQESLDGVEDGSAVAVSETTTTTTTVVKTVRTAVMARRSLAGQEMNAFFARSFLRASAEGDARAGPASATNTPAITGVGDSPRLAAAAPGRSVGHGTTSGLTLSGGGGSNGGSTQQRGRRLLRNVVAPFEGSVSSPRLSSSSLRIPRPSASGGRRSGFPEQTGGVSLARPTTRRPVLLLPDGVADAGTEGGAGGESEGGARARMQDGRPMSPVRSVIDLTAGRAGRSPPPTRHEPMGDLGTRDQPLELSPNSEGRLAVDGTVRAVGGQGPGRVDLASLLEDSDSDHFDMPPIPSAVRGAGSSARRPAFRPDNALTEAEFELFTTTAKGAGESVGSVWRRGGGGSTPQGAEGQAMEEEEEEEEKEEEEKEEEEKEEASPTQGLGGQPIEEEGGEGQEQGRGGGSGGRSARRGGTKGKGKRKEVAPLIGPEDLPRCAVCKDRMEPQEDITTLLECGHQFHRFCIHTWLTEQKGTCPTCRVDLKVY